LNLEQLEDRTVPTAIMQPTYHIFNPGYVFNHGWDFNYWGQPFAGTSAPAGLNPTQIRHAYGIDQITFGSSKIVGDGTGQTIAIVDAYDDSSAASDLTSFDQQFGLANPTFIKVGIDANGNASTTNFPPGDTNWAVEEALDVEWSHAVAPKATILLVEANSASITDLLAAVDYASKYTGVAAVSMSWGAGEFLGETSYDSHFTTPAGHTGVTFFASSGDSGAPAGWPSISDHVVSTGGTTLNVDSSGNYQSESGWSGSGGGPSAYYSAPSYQNNLKVYGVNVNGMRAAPDVAYDSDPKTGVAVLASYGYGGWVQVGGTSAASPQWAGLMAIIDQGRVLANESPLDGYTQTLPDLYQLASADFNDITSGNNGYPAGPGFDLVTGLGTPVANKLVADMVGSSVNQTLTSITISPANPKVGDGHQQQFTATALDQNNHNMIPQPTFTWSMVSGLGSITTAGLYTAPGSGSGTDVIQVSATVNGVTVTTKENVSYLPGPSITLTANSPVGGTTSILTAQVSDSNPGNLTYSWSVLSSPTGATAPTLNPSSGSSSTLNFSTSSTATFSQAGNYQFQFSVTDGAGVTSTAPVSVTVTQTYSGVSISPATVTLFNGAQQQFTASALDQFGNALTTQPAFSWSVIGSGVIDTTGLYTAPSTGYGTDTVGASATVNGATLSNTASVTYLPGLVIRSINANPNPVTGTTTTLSVDVLNPFGGPLYYYWSVLSGPNMVGFTSPNSASTMAYFSMAGSYTFQVMAYSPIGNQMVSQTVAVTVNSTLTTIMMMPATATVADGAQQQFNAYALDQFNQYMPGTIFSWSVTSGPGSVNSNGLYTAPASGTGTAIVQAQATVNGVTMSATATVTLLAPPIITGIYANPNPVKGTSTTLSVTATDPNGGSLYYGWFLSSGPAGVGFSSANASTTTAYFSMAGTYTFQVMVYNQANLMTSASVTVTVQSVFSSIMIVPTSPYVRHGSQMQFMAVALDQFHNHMSGQPVFSWSKVSGAGSVTSGGLYLAPRFGTGKAVLRAKATINGVTLSNTVTVSVY
jgi:hypothetical protein